MVTDDDGRHTGRFLVSLRGREVPAHLQQLRRSGITQVATSSDFLAAAAPPWWDADALLLERLGVAVLRVEPERAVRAAAGADLVRHVERERYVHASAQTDDALADDAERTWGLQALGAQLPRRFDGDGVTVAVLDTGVDAGHPDLPDDLVAVSLVQGEGPEDGNGHGTHVAGTVCGQPADGPAYGVAPAVSLLSGKVLASSGSGREADVLAGIDLAVDRGARVVSMSLGSLPVPGESYSRVFEDVAADLLADGPGVVLVAAAGNESERSRGRVAPLGRPASSPSVLAVAALDRSLAVAGFSNAASGADAGQVDVAGPGTEVLSSWLAGQRRELSGTSMATPHVSGVLTLILQAHPGWTAAQAVAELHRLARRLPGEPVDVGVGLVQAPR